MAAIRSPLEELSLRSDLRQSAYRSPILRPINITLIWVGIGIPFALQQYEQMRGMPNHIPLLMALELWVLYGLICAAGFLITRRILGTRLQTGSWKYLLTILLPFSIVLGILEEAVYVVFWQMIRPLAIHYSYLELVWYVVREDLVTILAFFWVAVLVVRGIGYYERYRSEELTASQLETELVNARLSALQSQLNPHFLFNTMNGISSLIHLNPDAADRVLEQLSRLLRMTLQRREQQQVPLREEIEFIQSYLEIQQARFGTKVKYKLDVAPDTWDALVPTMILQPIVENAYRHGLSGETDGGEIRIKTSVIGQQLSLKVTNTGRGLHGTSKAKESHSGMGISNVKARLQLHYRNKQSFTLKESEPGITEASITMPFNPVDDERESVGALLT